MAQVIQHLPNKVQGPEFKPWYFQDKQKIGS
jgi:hypothetical protein